MEKIKQTLNTVFRSPLQDWRQFSIVLSVAFAFIFMPQLEPVDWNLNTEGFWSEFPNTYADPTKVYPPWGLILMLPYYWMGAAGARVLSVMVVGWLAKRRNWTVIQFLFAVLSPYFLVTMTKSNMDIFSMLLPLLIWEFSDGKRWQKGGWALAMSLSLLKPQGMIFVWLYWICSTRERWREWIPPVILTAVIVLPISLVGNPPLILQWLNNLIHPDPQNEFYWSINNLSLTVKYGLLPALGLIALSASIFLVLIRMGLMKWNRNKIYASLLIVSFLLMPYASQQSVSSAFTLLPSLPAFIAQFAGVFLGINYLHYLDHIPLFVLVFSVLNLIFYNPRES